MKKWLIFFTAFILLVCVSFASYLYVNRTDFTASYLSRLFHTKASIDDISWHADSIVFTNIKLDAATYSATVEIPFSEQVALFFGYRPVIIQKLTVECSSPVQSSTLQHPSTRPCSRTFIVEEIVLNGKECTGLHYPATGDEIVLAIANLAK